MCLNAITERLKPTARARVGYKVFQRVDERLLFPYFGNGAIPRKKWLKAEGISIKIYLSACGVRDFAHYHQGFHFFLTKYGARKYRRHIIADTNWIIKKVRVRGIHTIGTDYGCRVGVARELFVP